MSLTKRSKVPEDFDAARAAEQLRAEMKRLREKWERISSDCDRIIQNENERVELDARARSAGL